MSDPRLTPSNTSILNRPGAAEFASGPQRLNRPESQVFFAPVEVSASPVSHNVLRSNLAPDSNGPPNPQLQAPLQQPPQHGTDHYAQSLRRYHAETTQQTIRDELFRANNPRNTKERLDALAFEHNHSTGLNWFGRLLTPSSWFRRNFWDAKLGAADSKGKASIDQNARPTTRLQQLIAHRDKDALLREFIQLAQTPDANLSASQRSRREQLGGDLLMVLRTQQKELKVLQDSRGLSQDEQHWSSLLDGQIENLTRWHAQTATGASPDSTGLAADIKHLWLFEPQALQSISNQSAIAEAAQHQDTELAQDYRQSALRDVMIAANREHLLPLSEDIYFPDMLERIDNVQQKRLWVNFAAKLKQQHPTGSTAARAYLERRQQAYAAVLNAIEKRGLLPELEQHIANNPPPAHATGLDHRIFNYRRRDGTALAVSMGQIDAVLADWKQEHKQTYLAKAAVFSKAWWTKIGIKMQSAFASVFDKGDKPDKIKGATKAGENVLDTVKNATEAKLEASEAHAESPGTSEHTEPQENTLGHKVEKLENAAHIVGVVEHVAGAAAGVKQAIHKGQAIKHKLDKKQQGDKLIKEHQQQLAAKQGRDAATFKYRSGVMQHYGHQLKHQEIAADALELGVVSGQATRHAVQTAGVGMKMAGQSAAVAGTMLVGGLGAAAVLEGGEAILGMIEAGKAGATKKELEEGAEKLRQDVLAKYGGGSIAEVKQRLQRLEKEVIEAESFLASHPNQAELDEVDQALVNAIEKQQPHRKSTIAAMRADLQRLADSEALVKILQDHQNHDVKTIVAVRSTLATAGYAMGFLVTIGVGGAALTIAAPVTMAVAGGAVIGTYAYKGVKKSHQNWRADRAADAVLGRADPKVVEKLKQMAADQNIDDPQRVAFNLIASKDMRWTAAQQLGQLKTEAVKANLRLSDQDIAQRAGISNADTLAQLDKEHQQAIYDASPTARFLHDVAKMPLDLIAAIVDAENDDEHDEIGRKLIEAHLDKE